VHLHPVHADDGTVTARAHGRRVAGFGDHCVLVRHQLVADVVMVPSNDATPTNRYGPAPNNAMDPSAKSTIVRFLAGRA
jgi:hypothetical protein